MKMSSLATVRGQKYETFVHGIGAPSCIEKCVFIPAFQLNLNQDGSVNPTEQHLQTLAAYRASQVVLNKIHSSQYRDQKGNFTISLQDRRRMVIQAMKEADKTSITSIQIPKDLADQIKELYDRSVDDNTSQGQARALKTDIRQIILNSGLFNQ